MDFSLNDYLLIFIITTSGLLLLFPRALSGGIKLINVKDAVLLMNREACTIIDVRTEEKFESVISIEGGFTEWVKLQLPVSQKNI